jgi:hypothetical protein
MPPKQTKTGAASSGLPSGPSSGLALVPVKKHKVLGQYQALMPAVQHVCSLLSNHVADNWTSGGAAEAPKPLHAVFDIDDTLIFDDNRQTPNLQVKHLLEVARAHNCKIHLVTAREKNAEVIKWTRDELRRHGIQYDTLALAPKKTRETMATIAAWKHSERAKHAPVLVSVGDQWGDILLLTDEADIAALDDKHKAQHAPWLVVMPNDGVTVYGLKLMA